MTDTMQKLISRLKASNQLAIDQLQSLDMSSKGATVRAAKLQSRAEAMAQAAEWAEQAEKAGQGV